MIASKKHIVMFWKKLMWFWSKKLSKSKKIDYLLYKMNFGQGYILQYKKSSFLGAIINKS
jgi:hypothetical protein